MTVATLVVEFTFIDAETGETESFTVVGEGQDSGDKAVYKALTGATKYALMKTFLIPTGDDPERDEEEPGGEKAQKKTQQRQPGSGRTANRKTSEKINEQQARDIAKLTVEICGNDSDKKRKLERWLADRIDGFLGLDEEMSNEMAAMVIRALVKFKEAQKQKAVAGGER